MRLSSKVMTLRGLSEESLKENNIALQETRSINARNLEAESLMGIAFCHATNGNHETAKALGEEARRIYSELENREGFANSAAFLGSVLVREGEIEKTQDLYEEGLAIYRNLGIRSGEAGMLAKLGTISFKQSRFDEAFGLYESARLIYHELGTRHLEAEIIRNQAMIHWSKGNLDAAGRFVVKPSIYSRKLETDVTNPRP